MKKLFALLFFTLFCTQAQAAVNAQEAENFIKKTTQQGIEELINANVSEAEKKTRFTKLFNDDLDLDFIGKFVLGRYWKTFPSGRSRLQIFVSSLPHIFLIIFRIINQCRKISNLNKQKINS